MNVVGEQAVRRAAKRLSSQGEEARRRARALGESRPDLVAYVVLATEELSPAARGAAWQGLELVCEATSALTRPRVGLDSIIDAQAQNDDLALAVAVAHPRFADRFLRNGGKLRQRPLLARIANDVAGLAVGERATVFLLLKTIIDVLDRPLR